MARIPYVEKSGAPQEVAELFTKMESRGAAVSNLWKMAAHSSSTLAHLIRLGNALLAKTKLDPRLREMAILRTGEILGCEYEIRIHAMFGKEVGMTDEQVRSIKDWQKSSAFSETEQAVLRFVDEVAQYARVKGETFLNLSRYLEPGMMVELALTVGFYGMLARILLPFEVDPDEEAFTSSTQIVGRS